MNLNDFVIEMRAKPSQFLDMWLAGNSENSVEWPLDMDAADWMDQFLVWLEGQDA